MPEDKPTPNKENEKKPSDIPLRAPKDALIQARAEAAAKLLGERHDPPQPIINASDDLRRAERAARVLGERNDNRLISPSTSSLLRALEASPLRSAFNPSPFESFLSAFLPSTSRLFVSSQQQELDDEIGQLRADANNKATEIQKLQDKIKELTTGSSEQETQLRLLTELNAKRDESLQEWQRKTQLKYLTDRVCAPAQTKLFQCLEFQKLFDTTKQCGMFVMSVDIRRSTELMLKAREPGLFAQFITSLCTELARIIMDSYGVFDKFTGDGILAFFPDFYSGPDAAFFVVEAAQKCHSAFQSQYAKHRHCFTSILKETGLGIGIDYGEAQLAPLFGSLTAVGTPVVYACRLGGAPAGNTLLNQRAYESAYKNHCAACKFDETEIEIKGEGTLIAYSVTFDENSQRPAPPDWDSLMKKYGAAGSDGK